MSFEQMKPIIPINTLIVDALIDGKIELLLKMVNSGLDVNFLVELKLQDLVEVWQRRLIKHHGVVLYPENPYTESEVDEMNTIEMIYHMGIEFHHPTPGTVEKVPLLIAIIRLEIDEIVPTLLDLHADVNIRDMHGCTPLLYAVDKKNSPIIQLLMKHGANPNIWSNARRAPLLSALLSRNEVNVCSLINAGADVEKLDDEGFYGSAIQLSICTGQYGCYSLLREGKADLGFINNHGENLLDTCCNVLKSNKFSEELSCSIFRDLLEGGAKIDDMKYFPKIPGDLYRYSNLNWLQMMLECGLQVSPRGTTQNTLPVLHEASCNPNSELLQFLIYNHHINLEIMDHEGRTVLLFACAEFPRVTSDKIKLLVDHGCNLRVLDQSNRSILESCIKPSYVADSFFWLMKRVSLLDTMKFYLFDTLCVKVYFAHCLSTFTHSLSKSIVRYTGVKPIFRIFVMVPTLACGSGRKPITQTRKKVFTPLYRNVLLLTQYGHTVHLKQVYKYLAVQNFKKELRDVIVCIEERPHYDYFIQCSEELKKMNEYPIGNHKLSDFITITEYSSIAREFELIEILFNTSLINMFPIYWCDMMVDLKEAVERQHLILDAMSGITKITGITYESCPMFMEQLTYHLSKIDLKTLSYV